MDPQSMPAYSEDLQSTTSTGKPQVLRSPTTDCMSFTPLNRSYPRIPSSSVGILHVSGYTPPEGEENVPIVVNFNCTADLAAGSHIRLVVGRRAVGTKVRELEPPGYGHWQLEAAVPPFARHNSASPNLPLTIQALTDDKTLLDSVTFGEFTYWLPEHEGHPAPMVRKHASSLSSNSSVIIRPTSIIGAPRSESSERSGRRSKPYSRPSTPASSSDSEPSQSRAHKLSTRAQAQPQGQGLRRTRQAADASDDGAQTAMLEIMVVLDSFCYNWDDLELQAGRRLVRFSRLQDGNKLLVSAERILPNEYDAKDIVISCIYREETDSCCVTSVDIIHLLQRLVGTEFVVEEKNRIRRNLEGLRPTTVSKSRPGFEGFFQRIMDFPDPKPRKIEKDLKVFDWKLLPQALDKIISKYSLSNFGPIPTKQSATYQSLEEVSATNTQPQPDFGVVHSEGSQESQMSQFSQYSQDSHPRQSPQLELEFPLDDSVFYHMPEDHIQPTYVGPEVVARYYSEPDHEPTYFVPSMTTYPAATTSPLSAPHHSPTWNMQGQHNTAIPSGALADHQSFEFIPSHESLDMYSIPQYNMHTYDSFEFQTLREYRMNAALASQVA
ncbi:hypothetical protein K503DRAFT_781102 [Rhizopogon vinicolor AM-OR11-026]|uniref:DUF7082 domain-containing protein n=1 Tax=Rhizopogon vinicolor AM-OR11-026 TaxID=1314800 RepID=A0A1B7N7M0_9AGAM|nr:hypothetical protein K503DRAFT_781102 [Rhizopogon vinicolor AM-OR11-026]